MREIIPLHHRVAQKIHELSTLGYYSKNKSESLTNGKYESKELDTTSFRLKGDIVVCDVRVYDGLTPQALKLVIRIQQELKKNNPLWECKKNNMNDGHVRAALAVLKRKGIIEAIKGTELFIVNPAMIRRGKPLTAYVLFYAYCEKQCLQDRRWKPSANDIKDLRSRGEIKLPMNHLDDFILDH